MILAQTANYNGKSNIGDEELYTRQVNFDITNIINCLQGRVRFGTPTSGKDGENISGQFVQYTSNGTPNTEDTISHTIGSTPIGYIILWQNKAGSFYQGPTTGTSWTSSAIYLKCSVASVTALLFLVK